MKNKYLVCQPVDSYKKYKMTKQVNGPLIEAIRPETIRLYDGQTIFGTGDLLVKDFGSNDKFFLRNKFHKNDIVTSDKKIYYKIINSRDTKMIDYASEYYAHTYDMIQVDQQKEYQEIKNSLISEMDFIVKQLTEFYVVDID